MKTEKIISEVLSKNKKIVTCELEREGKIFTYKYSGEFYGSDKYKLSLYHIEKSNNPRLVKRSKNSRSRRYNDMLGLPDIFTQNEHGFSIDHLDRDSMNDCLDNLVFANQAENSSNTSRGDKYSFGGVRWDVRMELWELSIAIPSYLRPLITGQIKNHSVRFGMSSTWHEAQETRQKVHFFFKELLNAGKKHTVKQLYSHLDQFKMSPREDGSVITPRRTILTATERKYGHLLDAYRQDKIDYLKQFGLTIDENCHVIPIPKQIELF